MQTITNTHTSSNHVPDPTNHRSTMVNIKGMYERMEFDVKTYGNVQTISAFNCYKIWFKEELLAMGLGVVKTEY